MADIEEQAAAIVHQEAEALRAHIATTQANLARLADDKTAVARAQRDNHRAALRVLARQAAERASAQISALFIQLGEQE